MDVAAAVVVAAAAAGRNVVVDLWRQHTERCCRMDPVAGVGLAAADAADIVAADVADGADDAAADWPYQCAAVAAAGSVGAVVGIQRQNVDQ